MNKYSVRIHLHLNYIHLCSFHILARSSGPSRHLRSLPSFAIYFCVSLPHLPSVSCLHSHFYINGRTFQRQKQQQFGFLSQQFARFEDAYYMHIDRAVGKWERLLCKEHRKLSCCTEFFFRNYCRKCMYIL